MYNCSFKKNQNHHTNTHIYLSTHKNQNHHTHTQMYIFPQKSNDYTTQSTERFSAMRGKVDKASLPKGPNGRALCRLCQVRCLLVYLCACVGIPTCSSYVHIHQYTHQITSPQTPARVPEEGQHLLLQGLRPRAPPTHRRRLRAQVSPGPYIFIMYVRMYVCVYTHPTTHKNMYICIHTQNNTKK